MTQQAQVRSISPHDHSFPALDGLRGLAVALVLLVHTAVEMQRQLGDRPGVHVTLSALNPIIAQGGTGVHLFFVLSGFLLFLPFARRIFCGGRAPDVARFYKRRALRILPAYYVAVLLTTLLFERDHLARSPVAQVVSHLLLVHNYSHNTIKGLDGVTWTMAVEAQFYVMLPVIAAAGWWLARRGRVWAAAGLAALLAVSPVVAAVDATIRHFRPSSDTTVLSAFSFLSTFACGMGVAALFALHQSGQLTPATQRLIGRCGGPLFAVLFGGQVLRSALGIGMPAVDYYGFEVIMGLCYAGLLALVLFAGGWASSALSRPAPRLLGDISYSVYLVHYPLIEYVAMPLAKHAPNAVALPAALALTVVLVIGVGLLSFWFIERPFLERKRQEPAAVPLSD